PAASSTISDNFAMISGTFQIILIEIAILAHFAIDLQRDATLGQVADFRGWAQRSTGGRMIEGFADLPWPLDVARGDLQIAPRETDADAITVEAGRRVFGGDVPTAAFERDDKLDLMMHVLG